MIDQHARPLPLTIVHLSRLDLPCRKAEQAALSLLCGVGSAATWHSVVKDQGPQIARALRGG